MAATALDSRVFRNLFGTQEMRDVFADHAYVQQMIEVEVALARAQSRVGVIPPHVGEALAKAVRDFEIE
jgi:3-carboxy-cis,cis-muconate cycloisomerase